MVPFTFVYRVHHIGLQGVVTLIWLVGLQIKVHSPEGVVCPSALCDLILILYLIAFTGNLIQLEKCSLNQCCLVEFKEKSGISKNHSWRCLLL